MANARAPAGRRRANVTSSRAHRSQELVQERAEALGDLAIRCAVLPHGAQNVSKRLPTDVCYSGRRRARRDWDTVLSRGELTGLSAGASAGGLRRHGGHEPMNAISAAREARSAPSAHATTFR